MRRARHAKLVAGGGHRIAYMWIAVGGSTDRVCECADLAAELRLRLGTRPRKLVAQLLRRERLQHAVMDGMRFDVHAGACERADVVPGHHQRVRAAARDIVAPLDIERAEQLVDKAVDVEPRRGLDRIVESPRQVRSQISMVSSRG